MALAARLVSLVQADAEKAAVLTREGFSVSGPGAHGMLKDD